MTQGSRSGSMFGPYQLRRLVGAGSMGEVYEAFDTVKERTVAIKLLPEQFSADPEYRDRFVRESQIVARLNNPHVVPVHNFGQIDGILFLEMVLVEGHDLGTLIGRNGPMPPQVAIDLLSQVGDATDAAHADGLVHRDIKPANIMVTSKGFAYLSDFGIASSKGPRQTTAGVVVGSVAYMAPERFTDGPTSPAVDIYSLGCVLFESLTGKVPFPRNDLQDVIHAHVGAPVPALPEPAAALAPVVQRAMAKNPADRYPTAAAMMAEARDAIAPPVPQASKVWRLAAIAAVVVALVAVSAGAWAWTHRAAAAVQMMAAGTTSADRFTDPVNTQNEADTAKEPHTRDNAPVTNTSSVSPSGTGTGDISNPMVGGGATGLYGTIGATAACDSARLRTLIDADAHKKQVWAKLQGIPVSDVDGFISGLAPVVLRVDTYVTNSDYKHKKYEAVTYPAVLQAGTAVLVDTSGMPRVKCNCGNPLLAPPSDVSTRPTTGKSWTGYQRTQVRQIVKSAKPISSIRTVDVKSGAQGTTPVGGAPAGDAKDAIKTADLGNATWTLPSEGNSDNLVSLKNGKGRKAFSGSGGMDYSLSANYPGGPKAIYADLNGDGYLDTIQTIHGTAYGATGVQISSYVWVWDPKTHKPVQLQPALVTGTGSDCYTTAKSISVDGSGVITVVENTESSGSCNTEQTLKFAVQGNTVKQVSASSAPPSPSSSPSSSTRPSPSSTTASGAVPPGATARQIATLAGCTGIKDNSVNGTVFGATSGATCTYGTQEIGIYAYSNRGAADKGVQMMKWLANSSNAHPTVLRDNTWVLFMRSSSTATLNQIKAKIGGWLVTV